MKILTLAGLAFAAIAASPVSAQQPGGGTPMTRASVQERIQQRFAAHDTNHDGFLSGDELGPDAAALVAQLDTDHDGKVSLAEATAVTLAHFDAADTNHDGTLTPEEQEAAMASMQHEQAPAPAQPAQPAQPQGN